MKLTTIIMAGSLIAIAACRTHAPIENDRVDIRGRITGIIPSEGRNPRIAGFIQVEGTRDSTTGYDKASITVTDSTTITRADGGRATTFADLREGDSVEARFTGPVRESYPVQADALSIRIISSR